MACETHREQLNPHFDFLLSAVYEYSAPAPLHLEDLRRSGLTDNTIRQQKIRSVPPHMIEALLGHPAPRVVSAYLIPFPDPGGGWFDHVRLKVFPSYEDAQGRTVKYLGPRGATPHLFFPLASLDAVRTSDTPLWLVEGAKKALAVTQLGLPAVGFEGIEGWHVAGARDLLPDFAFIPLKDRLVELVPDGDVATNPHVERGAARLARALEHVDARVRLVRLPAQLVA